MTHMRIGLARHFPVSVPWPSGWRTSAELQTWREQYDHAEVISFPVPDETPNWSHCYTSDLPRAEKTARTLFRAAVTPLSLLREGEFGPFPTGRLRLPVWIWYRVIRLAWLAGHPSQKHLRDDFFRRVRAVADIIESHQEDLLLVSHAGMMLYLRKELIRRGFRGPRFDTAQHARVYEFHRQSVARTSTSIGVTLLPEASLERKDLPKRNTRIFSKTAVAHASREG